MASDFIDEDRESKPTDAVTSKKTPLPSWKDVKAALLAFDRTGLLGLVQDLYAVSKDNREFLHARLGLGADPLASYKASVSRWICPDLMRNQAVSVSKAKKTIADYKMAIGHPEGLAELSIFYCEEAFSFIESCSWDDERYFGVLVNMYHQSVQCVLNLPPVERRSYAERLGNLRSRATNLRSRATKVGWGLEDSTSGRRQDRVRSAFAPASRAGHAAAPASSRNNPCPEAH